MFAPEKTGNSAADAVMKELIADRGDIFDEFHFMAREQPVTVNLIRRSAGYVHQYENQTTPKQQLSCQMRELIALCVRGEVDLAAQHIRRAYAWGMNRFQVLEAISCVLPMTGAVSIQLGARAMQLAGQNT